MTVVAVYVGGPLDGEKREVPDARERMVHARLPRFDSDAPVDYRPVVTHTIYTKRILRTSSGGLPFELYAPRDMDDRQMLERLVEYYLPPPEESQ